MSEILRSTPHDEVTDATAEQRKQPLAKADLHLHTNLGDGTASPERVLSEAKRRGLRVIAITDHDHMEGAKHVQELIDRGKGEGIELIWGCEVTAREGHFLGLFMKSRASS